MMSPRNIAHESQNLFILNTVMIKTLVVFTTKHIPLMKIFHTFDFWFNQIGLIILISINIHVTIWFISLSIKRGVTVWKVATGQLTLKCFSSDQNPNFAVLEKPLAYHKWYIKVLSNNWYMIYDEICRLHNRHLAKTECVEFFFMNCTNNTYLIVKTTRVLINYPQTLVMPDFECGGYLSIVY